MFGQCERLLSPFLREIKSRLGILDEVKTADMNTSSSDSNMLQLHDKLNTEQALLSELQHRQDNGQTSVHSLEQNVDGHSPATAKLLSDITILRNIRISYVSYRSNVFHDWDGVYQCLVNVNVYCLHLLQNISQNGYIRQELGSSWGMTVYILF
jgi:hypothetical protein